MLWQEVHDCEEPSEGMRSRNTKIEEISIPHPYVGGEDTDIATMAESMPVTLTTQRLKESEGEGQKWARDLVLLAFISLSLIA